VKIFLFCLTIRRTVLGRISKLFILTANNVKVKLLEAGKIKGYFKERLEPEIIKHYARENR
jgi:hypothetical protein